MRWGTGCRYTWPRTGTGSVTTSGVLPASSSLQTTCPYSSIHCIQHEMDTIKWMYEVGRWRLCITIFVQYCKSTRLIVLFIYCYSELSSLYRPELRRSSSWKGSHSSVTKRLNLLMQSRYALVWAHLIVIQPVSYENKSMHLNEKISGIKLRDQLLLNCFVPNYWDLNPQLFLINIKITRKTPVIVGLSSLI